MRDERNPDEYAGRGGDVAALIRTVEEMEAEYGPMPTAREACPLCGAAPGVGPHKEDCPWLIWARSPRPKP